MGNEPCDKQGTRKWKKRELVSYPACTNVRFADFKSCPLSDFGIVVLTATADSKCFVFPTVDVLSKW